MKFFLLEGRFPKDKKELPSVALQYLAEQLNVDGGVFDGYDFNSRTAKRDREVIRDQLGFRRFTAEDSHTLAAWLCDHKHEHVYRQWRGAAGTNLNPIDAAFRAGNSFWIEPSGSRVTISSTRRIRHCWNLAK